MFLESRDDKRDVGADGGVFSGHETAVVVTVDAPALEAIFRTPDPSFVERSTIWLPYMLGIPPHVTLLYPFVPPGELGLALPLLQAVVAGQDRFAFELSEVRIFSRTIWLAPEPDRPFIALTKAIEAAFPNYPHWGGEFEEVIPHLTLADGVEAPALEPTLARLRALVEPLLPMKLAADDATILVNEPSGHWVAAARLPLGTVG